MDRYQKLRQFRNRGFFTVERALPPGVGRKAGRKLPLPGGQPCWAQEAPPGRAWQDQKLYAGIGNHVAAESVLRHCGCLPKTAAERLKQSFKRILGLKSSGCKIAELSPTSDCTMWQGLD